MGYIDSNMMDGEQIVFSTRLHKILFFWPLIFCGAFIYLGYWLSLNGDMVSQWLSLNVNIPAYSGLSYIVAIIVLIPACIQYLTTEFVVTNQRVVVKVGFMSRRTMETLLLKIAVIEVDQSFLGRIFNWGSISVVDTGGDKENFQNIANPMEFRRCVEELTLKQ